MNNYTFKKATGEGLSQCQKCGTVSWDCSMFAVKEFDNHRVCEQCKKHMENNTEHLIKINWIGFKPNF